MLNEHFHVSRVLVDCCVNFPVRSVKVRGPCLPPGSENEEILLNASKISFLCVCVCCGRWRHEDTCSYLGKWSVSWDYHLKVLSKMVNPGKAKGRNHAFLSGQFLIFKGVPGFQEATSVYVYKARNLGKVAGNVRLFFFFLDHCVNTSVSGNSPFPFFLALSFCYPVVLVWFTQWWKSCVCPKAREEMEGDSGGGQERREWNPSDKHGRTVIINLNTQDINEI